MFLHFDEYGSETETCNFRAKSWNVKLLFDEMFNQCQCQNNQKLGKNEKLDRGRIVW